MCWTISDLHSCYFVFNKLNGLNVIAKVYVILDHPSVSLGIFSRCSGAANSTVLGPIWANFELMQDIIVALVSCLIEKDQIENEAARVLTRLSLL